MPAAHDEKWMSSPQWMATSKWVLERDGYRCQIKAPGCKGKATDADHIVPWRDGGAKFDARNLRAACRPCNIRRAQAQKSRDGWRRSAARIVLVAGPPGAGKSTYVREQATVRDLVVDYDAISGAFGPTARGAGGGRHDLVNRVRGSVLTQIRRGEVDAQTIYIVSTNPKAEDMFPHHEAVVIDPGRDEVLSRCGAERPARFVGLVDDWYAKRDGSVAAREW